jgi:hypothetical protein
MSGNIIFLIIDVPEPPCDENEISICSNGDNELCTNRGRHWTTETMAQVGSDCSVGGKERS